MYDSIKILDIRYYTAFEVLFPKKNFKADFLKINKKTNGFEQPWF